MSGLQEVLKLILKQLDILKMKLEVISNLGYKYLGAVVYAIKMSAEFVESNPLDNAMEVFNNNPITNLINNGIEVGLGINTPDFDAMFYKCPFLAELFGPFSNKNLKIGAKIDFGDTKISLNEIIQKYKETIEEIRSLFRSLTDTLTEKAMFLLYQYELFLIKSGVFDLMELIDKIYKCLENLYEISIQPEENLLNSSRPKLMINGNSLDLIAIANNAEVTSESLTNIYTPYRNKMMPVLPTGSNDKVKNYISQIRNSVSIF